MGDCMSQPTELTDGTQQRLDAITLENELYRRAQVALAQDREEISALFEDAPVGLLLLEPDGKLKRCNRRAQQALGLVADDVAESNLHDFVCGPSAVELAEHLSCIGGIGRRGPSDLLLQRADGTAFWARVRSELSLCAQDGARRVLLTLDEIEDPERDLCGRIEALSRADVSRSLRPQLASGRVMVVDDDELVLNATARVLHRLGHEIASYSDPHAALAAFEGSPMDYDAVIVDYQMPQMDGLALCEEFLARRSDLPILLTSAFTGEIDAAYARQIGVEQILAKPLSTEELCEWLRDAVSGLA